MNFLRDLHILILGLGDSGLAMARWARRCGAAAVRVADTREAPPQAARLADDVPGAELRCGPLDVALLEGMQLVLKSPGLSPLDAQVAPLLHAAAERGLHVMGELQLFARALADLKAQRGYAPKVLAITGTNGKTTTTSMTALLVGRCGLRTAMAGNIGPTLLDTLGAALDLEPVAVAVAVAVDELPSPCPSPAAAGEGTHAPAGALSAELSVPMGAAGDEPTTPLIEDGAVPTTASPVESLETPSPAGAGEGGGEGGDIVLAPVPDEGLTAEEIVEAGGGPPPHLIPPPPPPPVFEHLPEAWVLELSSFQLDGVTGFEPTAATVLNLTQDHLDWHGDMAAYGAAKARIFGKQGVLVINRDDPLVERLVPEPEVVKAAGRGKPARTLERKVVRFGLDAPRHPGDFGLVVEGGMAWLVRAHEADETAAPRRRKDSEPEEITLQRLMPADALRVRGRHNAANALAALALATAAGLPLAPMLHGLREYTGEPHRVQHVGRVRGIDAVDDSKGTNVGATVAALNGLGPDQSPGRLVVLLGGDGKGQDFTPLAAPLQRFARAVATLGRDAPAIEAAVAEAVQDLPLQRFATLEAATAWAFEQARPGDAVLLSPACASLDMFRNYAHRAEVFVQAVHQLADAAGELIA